MSGVDWQCFGCRKEGTVMCGSPWPVWCHDCQQKTPDEKRAILTAWIDTVSAPDALKRYYRERLKTADMDDLFGDWMAFQGSQDHPRVPKPLVEIRNKLR